MSERLFENDIREYAKLVNVPKAVYELIKDLNIDFKRTHMINTGLVCMSSYGSFVGQVIDSHIFKYLTKYSELKFRKGNDTKDEDCVCDANPFYNTEIKTTCSPEQMMRGARSNAAEGHAEKSTKYITDDYHFYIFVALQKPQTSYNDLKVANIWIGKMKPSDWSTSKTNRSSGAYVKKDLFNKQFINVKDLY